MQPPDTHQENKNARVPSPKHQPNASTSKLILVEPNLEIQRVYNSIRRDYPDEVTEDVSSSRGRPTLKADLEVTLKRKLRLVCTFHRDKKCNCHDFSKLEEGYQRYIAQSKKTEGLDRNGSVKLPQPDIKKDGVSDGPLLTPSGSSQTTINFSVFCSIPPSNYQDYYVQPSQPDELGAGIASFYPPGSFESQPAWYQELWQETFPFIRDVLIDRTAAHVWARHSLRMLGRHRMERILNELLRHRGLEITSKFAPKNPELTTLVEKFRLQISRYFCEVALSEPSNTSTVQRSPHGRKEDQKSEIEAQVTFQNQRISRLMKRVREVDLLVLFNWITRTFKNPTLDCLARDIRRALYFDDLFNKRDICHQIKRNISTNTPMARIELDWKPFEFFESQFRGIIPDIGSLVTLTGSALYAHATTCKSYLQSTWPRTWEPFLVALQSAMEAEARPFAPFQHTFVMDSDIIKFQFMPDQTLSVLIGGKMETIIDVAQQISWLSAALSLSPFEQKVAYCNARLVCSPSHTGKPRFKVERVFAQPQSIEESCWLPLFSNAALVWGFPIPARGGEIGLEISIDLLAAIAGVRHAAEYDGGIVMKGFSCMLIPIKLDTIADTVQWHLVSSQDEATRLSYQEGIARCPNRALLSDLDLQTLLTTRAILGWCSTVETVLGGNDINYDNIFYSTAQDAKKPVKLQNLAVGFQQFGTAQMEFTLGPKDGTCHFQRQGPYRKIVNAAEITPIVLFDTGERRGWLVPASGVLLHIIQHRNWLDGLSSKGWLSLKQGTSFREVLLQNESMALFDEENYEFKHMIADIWSILEFLLDQRVSASNDPGLTVKSPFQEIIQGYEFKAIVEDRSPLKLKQFRVEKTSGGWPSLVRDIDALVLFADGFENLIQPVQGDHGLCHMWKTVPKDKDYLATTVKMLNELYDVAGCRLDKQYLTSSRLQLDRGHSILFEACNKVSAWQCKCNRLLQIVPKKSFGVVPPGPLQEEGGIIFGQSSTLLNDCRKPTPSAPREISIYSQPNKTFNSVDDALVEDKESASCFWEHSTDAALPSIPTRPSTDTNESPLPYQDSPGEESEDLDVGNYLRPSKKRGYDPELKTDGEVSQAHNMPMHSKRLRRVDVSINGSKSDIKAAGCQEAQA